MKTEPTQEQLATIAAATQIKNPTRAVQRASELWATAGAQIEAEAFAGVAMPQKFPATLADFLRLVVRGKGTAEKTKRLRDFYTAEHARPLMFKGKLAPEDQVCAERRAGDEIAAWKAGGFRDTGSAPKVERAEEKWRRLAVRYLAWWKSQKSVKARDSALKRKKAPKSAPVVKKLS
jgi:hypothetical protein